MYGLISADMYASFKLTNKCDCREEGRNVTSQKSRRNGLLYKTESALASNFNGGKKTTYFILTFFLIEIVPVYK